MAKDPAFPFYTQDFLTGIMFMTNEEVGVYIKLLCIQHQHGGLIEKDVFKMYTSGNPKITCKFIETDEGFYNLRLMIEMVKRQQKSSNLSENAKKRWSMQMQSKCNANAMPAEDENEKEIEKENIKRKDKGSHPFFANKAFKTAFKDFLDMRKAKKKPATDRAKALILKDLEKHPINTAILMLEQSIKNSWTDVYPLKDKAQETKKPNYDEWEKKANKSCTNCRGTGKVYAPGSGQYGKCGCVK